MSTYPAWGHDASRTCGVEEQIFYEPPSRAVPSLGEVRAKLGIQVPDVPDVLSTKVQHLKETPSLDLSLENWPGVYRLWNADNICLYVGQATRPHPLLRIADHQKKTWWTEVARADFIPCPYSALLDDFERYQISLLNPKYNTRIDRLRYPELWVG